MAKHARATTTADSLETLIRDTCTADQIQGEAVSRAAQTYKNEIDLETRLDIAIDLLAEAPRLGLRSEQVRDLLRLIVPSDVRSE